MVDDGAAKLIGCNEPGRMSNVADLADLVRRVASRLAAQADAGDIAAFAPRADHRIAHVDLNGISKRRLAGHWTNQRVRVSPAALRALRVQGAAKPLADRDRHGRWRLNRNRCLPRLRLQKALQNSLTNGRADGDGAAALVIDADFQDAALPGLMRQR